MKIATNKTDIQDLTGEELRRWLADRGIRPFHAGQVLRWVHRRQSDDFSTMSDLSKTLRSLLSEHFHVRRLAVDRVAAAADGTRKFLFGLADGQQVETVLIPERGHHTLCISTQVGCAQGCRFCMTARGGLVRNLTRGEIVAQVRDVAALAAAEDLNLTNVVLMGMGEPLANYRHVVDALSVITDADCGLGFSARRVTLSTVGLVPRMAQLAADSRVNLAVSLNAADDETRGALMPVNRRYPLDSLMAACRDYPLAPRRRITFEYILIADVNDRPGDARRLVALLHGIRAKVNLIPFNEHPGCDFRRPAQPVIDAFQRRLLDAGLTAVVRYSKGGDIAAACGQLRGGGSETGPRGGCPGNGGLASE
jgi:23S rRNA (adenine2503-C2)-methyltransferase